jgi:hypothetical protein
LFVLLEQAIADVAWVVIMVNADEWRESKQNQADSVSHTGSICFGRRVIRTRVSRNFHRVMREVSRAEILQLVVLLEAG